LDAVQVAVSNTNDSNISKLWHKDLSRIAAFDNIAGVEVFNSYGRSFGLTDGAGANTWCWCRRDAAGLQSPQQRLRARRRARSIAAVRRAARTVLRGGRRAVVAAVSAPAPSPVSAWYASLE
jgi:hypothetical protein